MRRWRRLLLASVTMCFAMGLLFHASGNPGVLVTESVDALEDAHVVAFGVKAATAGGASDMKFGSEKKGATTLGATRNYIRTTWFSCPEAGTATSVTAYFSQNGANTPRVKFAIYRKS